MLNLKEYFKEKTLNDVLMLLNNENQIREICFFSKTELTIFPYKGNFVTLNLTKKIEDHSDDKLKDLLSIILN